MFVYFSMEEIPVQDIIEEISVKKESDNDKEAFIELSLQDFSESDIDYQEDDSQDDNYIQVDNIGDGVERIVDVLGGIFVNSDGSTVSDIFTRMNENIEKHNELVEKNNKILYRLSKVLEDFVKKQ
ncbi:hypothetical protein PBCVNY2B_843L [Paramecium bursaria Chlorella virus NY2B]|uniref:Uncharacterized protein n=1 Tax=Paramecium bursaria Chlorella virus NYs1 TaxID=83442 RepID=M1I8S7_9PHYC|nr:hypothetical protein AR158_C736L [Paramecium bursaria Chlorella virus AR158]YP_009665554.1 hypothetical protein FK949_gp216 [Paramecium bursaria Chlorella virus NYs1]AGE54409.1 hypothetical protein PBCVIL52s1_865L [Paramecium bursaria Chlorella virus IL-5-2s1]AGE55092.1 hypothetical protein PBCVMA1D_845L [Paramecium bursaria Chlorella virus MA1D]AGE58529.1 hypothetical protein PBCVNY2B_843L [Paramecium bursaria Chlorella virus NY2B]ABU44281.1 hypothetical protein AR158_C736L [Paramecium bur